MIKKLDRLILKAFVGPFIATFFITLFVLVLQFFWLYIDDIVGKGLDLLIIGELMAYVSATVVPLALPLAVLLSSIMTFGNLGETFELVAIKSAGIPLLRFMQPLTAASLVICGIAFLFNNYIIPVANLKLNTLKYDIIVAKPAFDIKEGVFYDKIDGYVIKIGKKEKDDSTISNIIIYEKQFGLQDHILVANSGVMKVSDDKKFLEFYLRDGWRHSEKGERQSVNTEYTRLGFKEYKKIFDLSSFKIAKTEDSVFKDNWKMLSVRQLGKAIDSIEKKNALYEQKVKREIGASLLFSTMLDSVKKWPASVKAVKSFKDILPDSARLNVLERSVSQVNSIKPTLELNAAEYAQKRKELRLHLIEWHRKFTMSIACLVLFLIGAPLGSIIRKGGIGTPLIIAVVFFIIFFLLNNFGERFVKEDVLQPFGGMWLATAILVPIGGFL
ncbi:MAG: LptF/LptG family permease, partial [Gemmatimonadaceae bacterium]|nr:LptF/LptG family permease [Chitinophagaceae bacterium]